MSFYYLHQHDRISNRDYILCFESRDGRDRFYADSPECRKLAYEQRIQLRTETNDEIRTARYGLVRAHRVALVAKPQHVTESGRTQLQIIKQNLLDHGVILGQNTDSL